MASRGARASLAPIVSATNPDQLADLLKAPALELDTWAIDILNQAECLTGRRRVPPGASLARPIAQMGSASDFHAGSTTAGARRLDWELILHPTQPEGF